MNRGFRDLKAYQQAYALAMEIFQASKKFPKEEKYALTDQLIRSSRAVCAIMAEGYRKRAYSKRFSLMMIDADAECSETTVHLDFALDCGYIDQALHTRFLSGYEEVGKMLSGMASKPEKFLPHR